MSTNTQNKKAPKSAKPQLFSIRKAGNVPGTEDRDILGSLSDYLAEAIEFSLSPNVRDINDPKCVTLRLDYEDTAETGEYGLLCFSKGLSKSLRNGTMMINQMLDYPIQKQLIFQDLENKEPLIDKETGEQVVKYIIARPAGEGRIKIKIGAKTTVKKEEEVW